MRCAIIFTAILCCFIDVGTVRADKVTLIAGGGTEADKVPATRAALQAPFAVDFDKGGNLYIAEMVGHRVRRVDSEGLLTTIAGTGKKGGAGDGKHATEAEFNGIHHFLVGDGDSLYVADTWNNRVRRIDIKSGMIAGFAGTGAKGFGGDGGPAAKAGFGGIYCLALDANGDKMYVADLDNRRIRAIDMKTGMVRTVAGNGKKGVPEDGAEAVNAPLVDPRAVAVDRKGNIYILERSGHALRVVDTAGKIRTVAGTGKAGATGDGGDARQATLNGPKHLCIDRDGGVLIADTENHLIRKYKPAEGKIIRIAGTGKKGIAGLNGPPDNVELNQPHGVFVHPSGDIYIADSSNNRVLRIDRGK
jgi:sugar lactone lactonase YvrE